MTNPFQPPSHNADSESFSTSAWRIALLPGNVVTRGFRLHTKQVPEGKELLQFDLQTAH